MAWIACHLSEAAALLFIAPEDARKAASDAGILAFQKKWPAALLGPREWAWRGPLSQKQGEHMLHIRWLGGISAPDPAYCRAHTCARKFKLVSVASC